MSMLRHSLKSARLLSGQPVAAAAGRQWPIAARQRARLGRRYYAKDSTSVPKPPVMPTSETQTSERNKPPSTLDDVGETEATNTPLTPPPPPQEKAPATEDDVGESSVSGAKINPLAGGKPKPPATEDDVGESSVSGAKISPLAGGKPKPPATEDDVGESSVAGQKIHPLAGGKPKPPASIDDVGESMAAASAAGQAGTPLHSQPSPASTSTPTPTPTPSPPAPKKKGFFRRLRNFVFTLMVLGAVGFGGGVWYSRINDDFHDFFTDYIPFGEQVVLYLEEKDFKRRFPHSPKTSTIPHGTDASVKIPAQSGASWRVADSAESSARQSNASPTSKKPSSKRTPDDPDKTSSPKPPALEADPPLAKSAERSTSQINASATNKPSGFQAPEVNEPSRFPPLKPIDLMSLPDAKDPVVRDLVHMVNDLILVINADGAHGKYGTTINKAKDEITKVGSRLNNMKKGVEKDAAKEVKAKIQEFDKAATELIKRVELAMVTQETQWKQDFEEEMKRVKESYDERVNVLIERERQLNNEKLQNRLLEQAIALKKEFVKGVEDRVEEERKGRLSKLNELTKSVSDLEKLTLGWNEVVDSNLQTQQLHVAVEAVRASLEAAQHPRPFIRELVALKEIASDDPVVDAAIASVNPSAYQRGVPTSSQLIDRFRRVASEVRKASLLPDEAGVASHASSWVLSHILFKKQGLAEGSDVESILTRTQTLLEEGDLDAAAREMNGLQGWAKTLSKDWMGEVRKVLEVQQALDVIATEARLQSLRVD